MLQISRAYEFCACHRLFTTVKEGHPCNCLHGHNYEGEVIIGVDHSMMKNDMIIDFSYLKGIIEQVTNTFDHRALLHYDDPLIPILSAEKQKITTFLRDPTVEYMTRIMTYMMQYRVLTFFNNSSHTFSFRKFEVSMYETKKSQGRFILNMEPVHALDIDNLRSQAKAIISREISIL